MRKSRALLGMMLCIAALTGGCATPALWGIKTCEPAPHPHLNVAYAPDRYEFLVNYDEQHNSSKPIENRSYWLLATADNPPKDRRPQFIANTNLTGLVTVPVVTNRNNSLPQTGYCAVSLFDERAFDLYHDGVDMGRFWLPNYSTHAEPANFKRVALTPPAVLTDTIIVSGVVAVYLAPYALEFWGSRH